MMDQDEWPTTMTEAVHDDAVFVGRVRVKTSRMNMGYLCGWWPIIPAKALRSMLYKSQSKWWSIVDKLRWTLLHEFAIVNSNVIDVQGKDMTHWMKRFGFTLVLAWMSASVLAQAVYGPTKSA